MTVYGIAGFHRDILQSFVQKSLEISRAFLHVTLCLGFQGCSLQLQGLESLEVAKEYSRP